MDDFPQHGRGRFPEGGSPGEKLRQFAGKRPLGSVEKFRQFPFRGDDGRKQDQAIPLRPLHKQFKQPPPRASAGDDDDETAEVERPGAGFLFPPIFLAQPLRR